MKTLPSTFQEALNNHKIVYTNILIFFDGVNDPVEINRNKFRVKNNKYTVNGGDGFPIGKSICKTIELEIDNTNFDFPNYDLYNAKIHLYSEIQVGTEYEKVLEGIFYVSDVDTPTQVINITAYDFMIKTELTNKIYTSVGGVQQWNNPWEYFVWLCDTHIADGLDITLETGQHLYATHLGTDRFTNSTLSLESIPSGVNDPEYTDREILGYIAQIASGNAVITYEGNYGEEEPKIDIVEYDLTNLNSGFINGGVATRVIEDSISSGLVTSTITDSISGGDFSDIAYIILDKYIQSPKIQFADVAYTGIQIGYDIKNPLPNQPKSYTKNTGTNENLLSLKNPILTQDAEDSTPLTDNTPINNFLNALDAKICNKDIRPFSGKFKGDITIEFMDIVVVIDRYGTAYNSFVTSHEYNYFGNSEIENNVPTVARNNEKYYNRST